MPNDRIAAQGLRTQNDRDVLGPTLMKAWRVEDASCFSELIEAIDEADRELTHERHHASAPAVAESAFT